MARIRTTLATAAVLGASLGLAVAAQAQSPYPAPYAANPVPPPAGAAPMAPPVAPGMAPHHRPMHPPGAASTYGMGAMTPAPMGAPNVSPTPAQPFSGLTLPSQQGVGNGAYNGGGVVLEYLPDGTTRVVR
ncbi:hypothetical protein BKE38_25950 [Pseudoroseomonas deserti]|uniref:Uncharacterized protein n=1 Tax=Teichococcus deserti TaxID=1817963 RepID=A0A1V2GUZ0_9PROT|nr:hypothetical protein [Pseudoroseomonas deserti]ONG45842.1 hypothetical protein BKE38_25950 [Pseudoroseomonas deserti]